jgi:hypothetical protein
LFTEASREDFKQKAAKICLRLWVGLRADYGGLLAVVGRHHELVSIECVQSKVLKTELGRSFLAFGERHGAFKFSIV